MIYVRQPTNDELRELKRMTRQEVGRVSQRAQIALLSAQRHTAPELATLFDLSRATIRFWLRRFDAAGPAGLYDEPRSGRRRKIDERVEHTVTRLLYADPQQAGYLATFWTVAMLALAVVQTIGVRLSQSAMRMLLRRLDLRWGRPRLAMPLKSDPDKAARQWAIAQAVVEASAETAILYGDESRIQLLPLIRAMWQWLGHQIRVPTPGANVTRTVFGALDIGTGRWVYLIRERMFKEDFIAFLEHLLVVYHDGRIILIVDNFSSHTAQAVTAWLAEHPRLRLFYLPKYCSHLNPVESIWRRLKEKIATNRLYGSMTALLDAVESFFTAMTPETALVWAAA